MASHYLYFFTKVPTNGEGRRSEGHRVGVSVEPMSGNGGEKQFNLVK